MGDAQIPVTIPKNERYQHRIPLVEPRAVIDLNPPHGSFSSVNFSVKCIVALSKPLLRRTARDHRHRGE
jgi:hypothetical protein